MRGQSPSLDEALSVLAEARAQSVDQMLAAAEDGIAEDEELDEPPLAAPPFEEVERAIGRLPPVACLAQLPCRALVEIRGGPLVFLAFACDPIRDLKAFSAVAVFPGEHIDFERYEFDRYQLFVLVREPKGPAVVTLPAFHRILSTSIAKKSGGAEWTFPVQNVRSLALDNGSHLFGGFLPAHPS